jgi:hypothetical protein
MHNVIDFAAEKSKRGFAHAARPAVASQSAGRSVRRGPMSLQSAQATITAAHVVEAAAIECDVTRDHFAANFPLLHGLVSDMAYYGDESRPERLTRAIHGRLNTLLSAVRDAWNAGKIDFFDDLAGTLLMPAAEVEAIYEATKVVCKSRRPTEEKLSAAYLLLRCEFTLHLLRDGIGDGEHFGTYLRDTIAEGRGYLPERHPQLAKGLLEGTLRGWLH